MVRGKNIRVLFLERDRFCTEELDGLRLPNWRRGAEQDAIKAHFFLFSFYLEPHQVDVCILRVTRLIASQDSPHILVASVNIGVLVLPGRTKIEVTHQHGML